MTVLKTAPVSAHAVPNLKRAVEISPECQKDRWKVKSSYVYFRSMKSNCNDHNLGCIISLSQGT